MHMIFQCAGILSRKLQWLLCGLFFSEHVSVENSNSSLLDSFDPELSSQIQVNDELYCASVELNSDFFPFSLVCM